MNEGATILIVDDEEPVLNALDRSLSKDGHTVVKTTSPKRALEILDTQPVDVIITDHLMPEMKGLDLLREVTRKKPDVVRIILTGHADLELAMNAINEGEVYRFFTKPWDDEALRLDVRLALSHKILEDKNQQLFVEVQRQAGLLQDLEKQYPGIGEVKRSATGAIIIDEEDSDPRVHPMPNPNSQPRILVVDDDRGCHRALRRTLEASGLRTGHANTLEQARQSLDAERPACILTEFRLPDGQGVDFLSDVRFRYEHVGRVMLTGVVDFSAVQDAVNQGAVHAFFTKPWENRSLSQGIRGVIEQCRLSLENAVMVRQLADHARTLEDTVRERTRQLELAKREALEVVFDSWDEPVAIVSDSMDVLRANRAYARRSNLDVREIPGRTCHKILFHRPAACAGCPVAEASDAGKDREGRVVRDGIGWRVTARPIGVGRSGPTLLVRYVMDT